METVWLIVLICTACRLTQAGYQSTGCDAGWTSMYGNCYLTVNSKTVTYQGAVDDCSNYDASLFYVDSQQELTNFNSIVAGAPSKAYWTGLNDIVNQNTNAPGDGVWKWEIYTFVNMSMITWSKSPGNDGQSLCGGINLQGNMYDADCSSLQGYICNIDNGVKAGCPLGWITTDTDCYFVSNTSDPSQLITWAQAKQQCVTLSANAHLITIDDVNDQAFLQNQLPFLSKTTYLHWTGLVGTGQAGGWKWFNGATFNQQLLTWATEPDNVAGLENCGAIRYNGKFSDRGCNQTLNYICKKASNYVETGFNLGCGTSWKRANQKCYLFHSGDQNTWTGAKQACQAMNGDLINIKDIDTKTWLQTLMTVDPKLDKVYWTALNDRDTEGVYKWGDGSQLDQTTINWNTEPNNYKGDEDCATIGVNGQFNDLACYVQQLPLCELDNVQTCPTNGGTWVSMPAVTGGGSNCYLFGDYTNPSNAMSQSEAATYCRSLAVQVTSPTTQQQTTLIPKLYSVDSAQERDFIKKQLLQYTNSPKGYWTELTDAQSEGFWTFANNPMSDTSFVEWGMQPSTLTPDTDCVIVGYGATFYVTKCSVKLNYICEKQALGTNSASETHGQRLYTVISVLLLSVITRVL